MTIETPQKCETNYSSVEPTQSIVEQVQVIAPSHLPEGYVFYATYNGVVFPVTVPPGGITKDEPILCPFKPPTVETKNQPFISPIASPYIHNTNHGHWKDNIFACLRIVGWKWSRCWISCE